jgi:uncharacterized membrane protein
MRRSFFALLIAAIAMCVPTARAQGQAVFTPPPYNSPHVAPAKTITLKACNHIKIAVSVAVTYGASETTQGWWGVPPGECKIIGPFDFQNGRIAYFATVGMDDGDRQNALYCLQMSAAFTTTKAHRTMDQTCPSGEELHAFDVVKADPAAPAVDATEWDFAIDF